MSLSNKEVIHKRTSELEKRLYGYPISEAFNSGMLKVSDTHEIYFEESGNSSGLPVLFLHGGPGSGANPNDRRFFNPSIYHIVLFDQRGCGRSTPHASLNENTTWHLIKDIEQIRQHLGIDCWLVFGGSWGSTLSLAYAQNHPSKVRALILRGIFLGRKTDIEWFYQFGASAIFPDAWENFITPIPEKERNDLVRAYYKKLCSPDEAEQLEAARYWSQWEGATTTLYPSAARTNAFSNPTFATAFARIECHYFVNNCFFDKRTAILENIDKIRNIPAMIIQGRYDACTPMRNAWDLHRAWPEAELTIITDAGHAATEAGITHELIRATNKFST